MNSAELADADGKLATAIDLYEEVIKGKTVKGMTDYLNLICIYFQCMDIGYASGLKLRPEVEANASARALELIKLAKVEFGRNDELEYWGKIIPYFGWGEPIENWNLDGSSNIPYLYLASENPTTFNIQCVKDLALEISDINESERKRYIKGKIAQVLSPVG